MLFSTNCRSQVWLSCSHSSDGPLAGPQDFTEALKAHTLATNVPLNTSTRLILLWAVLLVAAPEKVAPLHECQTGPGIQEFAAGSVVEAPFLATWLFARFPLAWRTNNSANPGRVGCIGIIVSSCGFAT